MKATSDGSSPIRKMFEQYDTDKSGEISSAEFRELCADMGYLFSENEAEMICQILDSDGNGNIGFAECIIVLTQFIIGGERMTNSKIYNYQRMISKL